jgi:hypothetical protein
MENSPAFDLNNAISRWRDGLNQSPHFREDNLAELEAHLRDSVADLQSRGLMNEEAFLLGARRLGNSAGLEPEFGKINRGRVWLHRLLWMLVGIQVWDLLLNVSRLAADMGVLGALMGLRYSFPEISRLSGGSLFASAVFGLAYLLALIGCGVGCWWLLRRVENTAHKVSLKALRRPILLGLVVSALFLVVRFSALMLATRALMMQGYSPEVYISVLTGRSLALFALTSLETLAFVILTIVLLRRRLCLRSAS